MNRPYNLMLVAPENLRQEEDESLHSFMENFLTIIVKIRDLNPEGRAPGNDESQKEGGNLEPADKQERQGRRRMKTQVPSLHSLTTSKVVLLEEAFNAKLIVLHP
ncbi:hypothetical protein CR513_16507, partial [Mucuna pruriens]